MRFAVLGLPRSRHLKSFILRQFGDSAHTFIICEERHREFIDGGWDGVEHGSNTEVVLFDRFDDDELAKRLDKEGIERIISLSDRTMLAAARLRERCRLPGNSLRSEQWVVDKGLMRQRLLECGLSAVDSLRTTVDRLVTDVAGHAFPLIVKPASLGASLCVELLRTPEDVVPYTERCRANRVFDDDDLVVEDYVAGPELSVEGVVSDGQVVFFGVTESHHSGAPYFIGTGHDFFPAHERAEEAYGFVRRVISALDMDDSLFHIELKCPQDGWEVIEVHTRFGGTMIGELVLHGTGIEVFSHYVDLLAGAAVQQPVPLVTGLCAQHLLCSPPGRIDHIDLAGEVTQDPRVLSHALDFADGEVVEADVLPVEYVGYVTFTAADRGEAAAFRDHCQRHLTVDMAGLTDREHAA
jgi:hypothetical protein